MKRNAHSVSVSAAETNLFAQAGQAAVEVLESRLLLAGAAPTFITALTDQYLTTSGGVLKPWRSGRRR